MSTTRADQAHSCGADVGIELDVTRRPFSFHGGDRASNEDESWLWGNGLCIYAGDMVIDKLKQFIPYAAILREETARALQDPNLLAGLQLMGQMTGHEVDIDALKRRITQLEAEPKQQIRARGKVLSAFDQFLGALTVRRCGR